MAWEKFENIKGPKGEKGPAGTISSVSSGTLPPGSPVRVAMSGREDVHVHFDIPQGVKGDRGPAGAIASASAESVPAEDQAAVIMSGTDDVKHAHFQVPRGLPGVNGVPAAEAVGTYLSAPDSPSQPGFATGTARLLDDTSSAAWASVTGRLEKISFNVRDYGAVGDGVTDDTPAVTTALEAVRDAGGGTLVFPPGTYLMVDWARVYSDTVISGHGATLVKSVGTGSTMCFGVISGGLPGYGAGGQRIRIEGFTFKGDFSKGRQIGVLGANHGDDIVISDCMFTEAHISGHIVDLQGCRRVTVVDCTFYGQDAAGSANPTKEAIQVDNSTRFGASVADAPSSYDGLPSTDITVERCSFLPVTAGGVRYPAPVPFGSHYGIDGYLHERVAFLNSVVVDPPSEITSPYRGVLHFCATRGIRVEGCTFRTTNSANTRIISNIPLTSTVAAEDFGSIVSPATVPLPSPVQSTGWVVRNNHFEGFNAATAPQALIYVRGSNAASQVNGVLIEGNVFKDCLSGPVESGFGPIPIEGYVCNELVVRGNILTNVRNLLSCGGSQVSRRITVEGNIVKGASQTAVIVADSVRQMVVAANLFEDVSVGVNFSGAAEHSVINGNVIGCRGTGVVVGAGTTGISTVGNNVTSSAGTPYSLAGTGNLAANNLPG